MGLERIKGWSGMFLLLGLLLALAGCSQENTAVKEALAASYAETYGARVCWVGEEPDQPRAGDIRLVSMELLGEAQVGEVSGAVYLVAASVFVMETEDSRWVAMEPCAEVILWSGTGEGAQEGDSLAYSCRSGDVSCHRPDDLSYGEPFLSE